MVYLVGASKLLNANNALSYNALRTETVNYKDFCEKWTEFQPRGQIEEYPLLIDLWIIETKM